jgi:two-component system LytT family response regulator
MSAGTKPLRVLVVDDEPLARQRIVELLAPEPELELVGEARSGTEAVRLIRLRSPDLVFLDVQLPEGDGFDVLGAVARHAPAVIFVTAYDQHAIRAFDHAAVDYLLKPVVEARFRAAVRRAVERARGAEASRLSDQVGQLLRRLDGPAIERLPIWSAGRVVFVDITDIDWIDAADDQVRLHVDGTTHVTRDSMRNMEARLPAGFVRIHRSVIVNTARIREVQPWFKGDWVVILTDGTKLTSGRTYRDRVRALLGRGAEPQAPGAP